MSEHEEKKEGLILQRMKEGPSKLLWLDLETGGLDIAKQPIIEVAARVTSSAFDVLENFHEVVFCSQDEVRQFEKVAYAMHEKNGLLAKLSAGKSRASVEEALCQLIRKHWTGSDKAILAGNSVHWDRFFLSFRMPKVADLLSHRVLDVSSWKTFFQLEYQIEVKKLAPHLASDDVDLSIAELKTYAALLNKPLIEAQKAALS